MIKDQRWSKVAAAATGDPSTFLVLEALPDAFGEFLWIVQSDCHVIKISNVNYVGGPSDLSYVR